MARLGCICGHGMSNVECPAKNVYYLFTEQEVQNALNEYPDIHLRDFYTNWNESEGKSEEFVNEKNEYWY